MVSVKGGLPFVDLDGLLDFFFQDSVCRKTIFSLMKPESTNLFSHNNNNVPDSSRDTQTPKVVSRNVQEDPERVDGDEKVKDSGRLTSTVTYKYISPNTKIIFFYALHTLK